ncbi:MAG: hypothetical protein DME19_16045 [Verrucomicrobia bacterium]|nr:MAG: hypothetical protein DME19_16045 [Verrucomicrobiota bacterium]
MLLKLWLCVHVRGLVLLPVIAVGAACKRCGSPASLCFFLAALLLLPAGDAIAQTTLPVDHFDFSTITSPKVGYVPFRVIITAKAANGTTARNFAGTVQLTAAEAGGAVPVEALTPLQFTSGLWAGVISVNTSNATSVTLTVADTAGHRGDAGPITIQAPPFRIIDLPVISLASDRVRGLLYASLGPPSPFAGQIAVIDPATGLVQDTIPVQGGAGRLELAHDASVLYAATRRIGVGPWRMGARFAELRR